MLMSTLMSAKRHPDGRAAQDPGAAGRPLRAEPAPALLVITRLSDNIPVRDAALPDRPMPSSAASRAVVYSCTSVVTTCFILAGLRPYDVAGRTRKRSTTN